MKKLTYLTLIFCAFLTVGCNDINVFTPVVEPLDANWDLSHYFSPVPTRMTTVTEQPKFTYSFDKTGKKLTIRNSFNYDARAIFNPYVNVINNGSRIEIEYREESPSINSNANVQATTIFNHEFTYTKIGRGNGANIPVQIRYTFPKPELGNNIVEPIKTLTY